MRLVYISSQCCGSGSLESVTFSWIQRKIFESGSTVNIKHLRKNHYLFIVNKVEISNNLKKGNKISILKRRWNRIRIFNLNSDRSKSVLFWGRSRPVFCNRDMTSYFSLTDIKSFCGKINLMTNNSPIEVYLFERNFNYR